MATPQAMFSGRVALVTGAASGIGRATAVAFAREGANVVVVDLEEQGGQETARRIEREGGRAIFVACDVARDRDVRAAIGAAVDTFGRLDCAFNNAGTVGERGTTAECSEDTWDRVIAINLKGVWLSMRHELPQMLKQGAGVIVNCSSVAGLVGFAGIPAYVASKHGVVGLTRSAALEVAKQNIRVNAVCPGVIRTPMIEHFTHGEPQILQQLVAGEPIGRIGTPEEVAGAVLWLCSDAASFVTGQAIAVDGGWAAQ